MSATTPLRVDVCTTEEAMRFADGALGAAGQAVTDAQTRQIIKEALDGELSAEDAIDMIVANVTKR